MAPAPTTSTVVPCYNAAAYVDDALDSVRGQTYPRLEIIAVDDGSTDDTWRRLERHAAADPRVRIIRQPNRGPSAARNAGLRQATGEYISFLDADDVFLPDKIQKQVAFFDRVPSADLVYSDYFEGDRLLTATTLVQVLIPGPRLLDAYARRNWFGTLAPLVRRRLIERVGEFDESLRAAEDWDYWIRCAREGPFHYLPGPVAIYRGHGGQAHHDRRKMFVAGRRVIEKEFRSDRARYRRALAAFYEATAKNAWGAGDWVGTGGYLALSMLNRALAAMTAEPSPDHPDGGSARRQDSGLPRP